MSRSSGVRGIDMASRVARFWARGEMLVARACLGVALVLLLGALAFGSLNASFVQVALLGLCILAMVFLRHDVFTAAAIAAIKIVFDWYQLIALPHQFPWVSLLTSIALLAILFYERRAEQPWRVLTRLDLWLWGLLLLIVALAIPRSLNVKDGIVYFVNVVVTAFVLWTLGNVIATDRARVRQLVVWLSIIGALIGIHTIIEGRLGIFLFETPRAATYLASKDFFEIDVGGARRAMSFLLNPDSDGAFLAMALFLPAGLLLAPSQRPWWLARLLPGGAVALMCVALLFTYSTAALVAAAGGVIVFTALAVPGRYRVVIFGLVGAVVVVALVAFHGPLAVLLRHIENPNAVAMRLGPWEIGLDAIRDHPLTGIGLGIGNKTYQLLTANYPRIPGSYSLEHPHNSYIELAALAGLPTLALYLTLLARSAVRALRNYQTSNWDYRPVLAGAIAALVALSIHGIADATWTLPPLVPIAWLILGAISSPALQHDRPGEAATAEAPSLQVTPRV